MKWYYHLVSKESDDKRQCLYENEIIESHNLIICQHIDIRYFAKFKTFFDFLKYLDNVKYSHQCFYEVIEKHLQKPYFDLDIYIKKTVTIEEASKMEGVPLLDSTPTVVKNELFTIEEAKEGLKCLILKIKELLPCILDSDILVFNSNSEVKYSYHVIVDRWCFVDNEDNKAFFNEIMKTFPEKYKAMVDHGMYKSIQQLRLYKSHKWESERVKVLDENSTWVPEEPPSNEKQENLQIFAASLISNATHCRILKSFKDPSIIKSIYTGPEVILTPNEVDKAMELFINFDGSNSRIHEIKGSLLLLKRLHPSMCKICNRVHEHIDPYLTVTGHDQKVWYHCRRASDDVKLMIGTIIPKGSDKNCIVSSLPFDIKITPTTLPTSSTDDVVEPTILSKDPIQESRTALSGEDLLKQMNLYRQNIPRTLTYNERKDNTIEFAKQFDVSDVTPGIIINKKLNKMKNEIPSIYS